MTTEPHLFLQGLSFLRGHHKLMSQKICRYFMTLFCFALVWGRTSWRNMLCPALRLWEFSSSMAYFLHHPQPWDRWLGPSSCFSVSRRWILARDLCGFLHLLIKERPLWDKPLVPSQIDFLCSCPGYVGPKQKTNGLGSEKDGRKTQGSVIISTSKGVFKEKFQQQRSP